MKGNGVGTLEEEVWHDTAESFPRRRTCDPSMGQMDRRGDSELVRCQFPKGFPPVSSCRVLLTSTQCQMFLRCVEVDPSQILLCGANGARPWCDSLLRVKACLSHGLINVHPWKKARW